MLTWGRRGSGLGKQPHAWGSRLDVHTELFVYVGASRRAYRIVCLRGSPFGAQTDVVQHPYSLYYSLRLKNWRRLESSINI